MFLGSLLLEMNCQGWSAQRRRTNQQFLARNSIFVLQRLVFVQKVATPTTVGQPSECYLAMFHPKYKNAPPIFHWNSMHPFHPQNWWLVPKKNDDDAYLDDSVHLLDHQQVSLEQLNNSDTVAASAMIHAKSSSSNDKNTTEYPEETLYCPAHEVVQLTCDLFDETTMTPN